MSVIQIPSKNIYSVENQKVIDNQIDKIEVQAKEVVPDNTYDESVYSEDISIENYTTGAFQDNAANDWKLNMTGDINTYACAYVSIVPYYTNTITITIPKRKNIKSIINKIKKGFDENGNTNIKYSSVCNILKGTVSARIPPFDKNYKVNDLTVEYPQYSENPQSVDIPKTLSKNEKYYVLNMLDMDVTASLTLEDKTNLGTLFVREENDSYIFDCILLCGAEIYEMSGSGKWDGKASGFPISGTATKYIPHAVSITVYGNTIGIDLKDKTVTIGSGTEVMSFSGNELIQTTNTPSLERQYQSVIDEWKDGKETAVIRCSIDDYYDQSGDKVIDITNDIVSPEIQLVFNGITDSEGVLRGRQFVGFGKVENLNAYSGSAYWKIECDYDPQTGYVDFAIYGHADEYITAEVTGTISAFPMTFSVGDIVVPYVYGANGQDKPMSTNIDGTPKKFAVVGKKPISNGAVWQELTLQEK